MVVGAVLFASLAAMVNAQAAASPAPAAAATPAIPAARACTPNNVLCAWIFDNGSPFVKILVEGPFNARWLGLGLGTQMPGADVAIGFMNSKQQPVLSDRFIPASGGGLTVDAQQDLQLMPYPRMAFGPTHATNRFVMQFVRPKQVAKGNPAGQDLPIDTSKAVDFIWAYNTNPDSVHGDDYKASLSMHENKGTLQVDLTNPAHRENARKTLAGFSNTGSNSSSSNNNATTTATETAVVTATANATDSSADTTPAPSDAVADPTSSSPTQPHGGAAPQRTHDPGVGFSAPVMQADPRIILNGTASQDTVLPGTMGASSAGAAGDATSTSGGVSTVHAALGPILLLALASLLVVC
ncbi:hypothetical protein RI367_003874 [Sorochytrium milnesiophthora]